WWRCTTRIGRHRTMSASPPSGDDGGEGSNPGDVDRILDTEDEAEVCVQYQDLIEQIKNLAEIAPPPGWEERAEQRWRASRSAMRRRRMMLVAVTLCLGLVVIMAAVVLRPCGATSASSMRARTPREASISISIGPRPRSIDCSIEIAAVVSRSDVYLDQPGVP